MGDIRRTERRTVLITGFGPFRNYKVNASWEAVKLIKLDRPDIELVKKEIPVIYQKVDEIVPQLWNELQPSLVIHCGVSYLAKCLVIESQAHTGNYHGEDILGLIPEQYKTPSSNGSMDCMCLTTQVNVRQVCDQINRRVNDGEIKVPACISRDAGRYLCEYIYCTSLKMDPARSVFIHVPELNNPYSAEELAGSLKVAIECLIDEMNQESCLNREVTLQNAEQMVIASAI